MTDNDLPFDALAAAFTRAHTDPRPTCGACGNELEVEDSVNGRDLYNDAGLLLCGGYGSFTDDLVEGPFAYIICEACAMKVCRALGLHAPIRHHHTSTVCNCPDRPARNERGFPLPCACADCLAAPWPAHSPE